MEISKISIHESGHCVMAIVNKIRFEKISLNPPFVNGISKGTVSELIAMAQVSMAGTIAERIHAKTLHSNMEGFTLQEADGNSFNKELSMIIEVPEEIMPLSSWLLVRTASQLMRRWNFVLAIAEALQKKGTLSYQECHMILLKFVR